MIFNLTINDLGKTILGCDGPASFNRWLTQKGKKVISIDPIYRFNVDEIASRIRETYPIVMEQTKKKRENFIWSRFKDVEELGKTRMKAMGEFLADYEDGKKKCCESLKK